MKISMRVMESTSGPIRACIKGSGRTELDMDMVLFRIRKAKSIKSNGKKDQKSSSKTMNETTLIIFTVISSD